MLVNGLPGAGKSTLGRSLATTLDAQFLSKDAVKEALAACVDDAEAVPELGGVAMDAVWALASAVRRSVVIDSWWFKPRDLRFAVAGIERARVDRVVEVWCRVPAEIARARYEARCRPAFFQDSQRLRNHWETWVEHAEPLGIVPTVCVDTTGPVDCTDLAARIERAARVWRSTDLRASEPKADSPPGLRGTDARTSLRLRRGESPEPL